MKKTNSRLVYSTESGRVKSKESLSKENISKNDQIYIRRETKGRKGKGVTVVEGLPLDNNALKSLAKQLKQACGTGGTVKQGLIEIQGEHRSTIKEVLEKLGYTPKIAGG